MVRWTTSTTGTCETITINIKLCEICKKRYHDVDSCECDYCLDYYWDNKMFRCNSPFFIRRKWLKLCYRLKIPYRLIRFFWRRDVA